MSEGPRATTKNVALVVAGVVFAVLWIGGHVLWATMSFMGTAMANDSGAAPAGAQATLILAVLIGQIIAASAGVPGGLAFFWSGRRRSLLIIFAMLFFVGVICQFWAFHTFVSAASSRP